MAKIDPEQERRRLNEFYSGQLDGELEKVATQAYELTELAREALRSELTRRGLTADLIETAPVIARKELPVQPGDPPPETPRLTQPPEPDGERELGLRELVTIRKFRDLPEALLANASEMVPVGAIDSGCELRIPCCLIRVCTASGRREAQ